MYSPNFLISNNGSFVKVIFKRPSPDVVSPSEHKNDTVASQNDIVSSKKNTVNTEKDSVKDTIGYKKDTVKDTVEHQ